MDKWEAYAAQTAFLIADRQLLSAYKLLKKAAKEQSNTELLGYLAELKAEIDRFNRRLKRGTVPSQEIQDVGVRMTDRLYYLIYCLEIGAE